MFTNYSVSIELNTELFIESHLSTDDQSETSTETSDDESGDYLDRTGNNQPDLLQLFVLYIN